MGIPKCFTERVLGRVYVTKSMLISQLIHIISVLPTLSEANIKKLNALLYKYVWKGGSERIQRETLKGPYDLGGIKMPDIRTLCDSLHLKWLQYILNKETTTRLWVLSNLPNIELDYLFQCNLAPRDTHHVYPRLENSIWMDVFWAWGRYRYQREIKSKIDIMNETIFWNSHIRISNKPIFNQTLYEAKIWYVKDLLDYDNHYFLTHENSKKKQVSV